MEATQAPVTERIEWIADRARFDDLAADWDRLADREGTPFSRHAWFQAWLDAFGPTDLCTCVLWRSDRLAAALPLRATTGGAATIANEHTPFLRPLGVDREAVMTLYEQTARELGQLVIEPLPYRFRRDDDLVQTASRRGIWTSTDSRHVSPIVDTAGDLNSWRERSKHGWGAPLERFRRKAVRERGAKLALLSAPKDLETELDECLQVEASGWKGKQETAVLSQPETTSFYRGVAAAFHERGELRLSTLRLDGRIAAFDLCLLHRGRLYLLKTGYDESFRKLAPGLLLQLSVIERCFETDLDAFELLGGDAEWKRKFATSERQHVSLRSFRHRPGPALLFAYRRAVRPPLKRAYRKGRGLWARVGDLRSMRTND
jgi:CelD/BcsL family acetyltransferase involved in cellulose biosynthesis